MTPNTLQGSQHCVICGRESTAPLCWRSECLAKDQADRAKEPKP